MVRNYKPKPGHRQNRKYDPEIMMKAYREILNGEGSLLKVAKKYNISKSSLHRRIRYNRNGVSGGQRAFTLEREEHIIKYIHACAPWQYQLQIWDLRLLIKFYLDRRPVITKRKIENNLPGQEYVTKLTQRQEDIIQQKVIQSIKDNGATTAEAIISYFHELKMLIRDLNPQNIICFNDILVIDEVEDSKTKETENVCTDNMFVMLATSASGGMLDPYISFKEKHCYENTPRRSIMSKHVHQQRKRLNIQIFEDWFKSIILPYYEGKSGKKCLIGSFFSSRITKDILAICKEHNINFVFLPDNSGNYTQPLHCLTQLIQTAWNDILSQKKTDSNRYTLTKDSFCEMTESLIANARDTVTEGFGKTGIHPFNPDEVLKQLPDYNEILIEDVDEDFEKRNTQIEIEPVQIKAEIGWSDQFSDDDNDDDDHEIASNWMQKKIKKDENGDGEIPLRVELKLSPVDFQEEMRYEDPSVDNIQNKILLNIDFDPMSHEKPTSKRRMSNKNNSTGTEIDSKKKKTKDSSNTAEIDPLSGCQSGASMETNDSHSENGTSSNNTRLLEAILSTVTRQEKLQERATIAMETQAQALASIAMLLERQASTTRP